MANKNMTLNQPKKLPKGIEKIENLSLRSVNQIHKPNESEYIDDDPLLTITGSIKRSREVVFTIRKYNLSNRNAAPY